MNGLLIYRVNDAGVNQALIKCRWRDADWTQILMREKEGKEGQKERARAKGRKK